MACPFFSGQIPISSENDGGLSDYEIYHRFMGTYSAYTINRIEAELSWRQVELLLACWEKEPPIVIRIAKVENMLEKKFGFKLISTSTTNKALSGDDTVNYLKGKGLL